MKDNALIKLHNIQFVFCIIGIVSLASILWAYTEHTETSMMLAIAGLIVGAVGLASIVMDDFDGWGFTGQRVLLTGSVVAILGLCGFAGWVAHQTLEGASKLGITFLLALVVTMSVYLGGEIWDLIGREQQRK